MVGGARVHGGAESWAQCDGVVFRPYDGKRKKMSKKVECIFDIPSCMRKLD